jgi:hypothetical protein
MHRLELRLVGVAAHLGNRVADEGSCDNCARPLGVARQVLDAEIDMPILVGTILW